MIIGERKGEDRLVGPTERGRGDLASVPASKSIANLSSTPSERGFARWALLSTGRFESERDASLPKVRPTPHPRSRSGA